MVSARTQKRMAILKLEGVDSIEQADLLRNRVLYASRQDFKLEPGRYFIQDLLGVKAVDADSGRDYGAVTDVLKTEPTMFTRSPETMERRICCLHPYDRH